MIQRFFTFAPFLHNPQICFFPRFTLVVNKLLRLVGNLQLFGNVFILYWSQ